jgi:hypothetical protein
MPALIEGQPIYIQGSAAKPYTLKNVGGVYSCDCVAWRMQSLPIDKRTCKHLKSHCGAAAEAARIGGTKTVTTAAAPAVVHAPTVGRSAPTPTVGAADLSRSPDEESPEEMLAAIFGKIPDVVNDHSDIPDRFNKYVAGNPDLAAIYKKAGRIHTSGDSFETRVSPNFGRHLKTSAWWTRNLKEIEKHKKNLKDVRKIMES